MPDPNQRESAPNPRGVAVEVPIAALGAVMAVIDLLGEHSRPTDERRSADPKVLLTLPDAAVRLSIGVSVLRQMVRRGDLAVVHPGGTRCTRIRAADLEEYADRLSCASGRGRPVRLGRVA